MTVYLVIVALKTTSYIFSMVCCVEYSKGYKNGQTGPR